jgi:hypothetical protein
MKFLKFFCLGAITAFTPILAPIHEFGHVVFGTEPKITDWNHTMLGKTTYQGLLGGLTFELIFFTILCAICWNVYKNNGKTIFLTLSAFSWGYVNGNVPAGCVSNDLVNLMPRIGVEPWHGIMTWLILSVPVLLAGWAYWRKILKRY